MLAVTFLVNTGVCIYAVQIGFLSLISIQTDNITTVADEATSCGKNFEKIGSIQRRRRMLVGENQKRT